MPTGRLLAILAAVASAKQLSNEELRQLYGVRHTEPRLLRTSVNTSQTLREAAAARGLYVGYASNKDHLASDPQYLSVGNANYNLATAENECKFDSLQPGKSQYDFTQCDAIASNIVQKAHGTFRGHNWVWNQQIPDWLQKGGFSPAQLLDIMRDHISTVGKHYAADSTLPAYCWDVVNEAVSDSGDNTTYKPSLWYPAVPDYVDQAFRFGREAVGPKVKLFYNDYGAEGYGTKSDKVYHLVAGMKARGVPIDGVGLQMHLSTTSYPSPQDVSGNIKRLCDLGLEVHITEMDVRCLPAPCDTAGLQTQAQVYGDILKACLDNTCCKNFETWGLTDKFTWLWDFQNPQHLDMKPLPFDTQYQPKPAYFELLATLQQHQRPEPTLVV